MEWDPSLEASELSGTVRFYKVLLTEPKQSSSALFFLYFSQSCPSFPAEMEP